MENVEGKVAFVTGGASGMGLAMVRSFASAGMKVVAADIQEDALDAVREEFADSNAELIALRVDVTDRESMKRAADDTEAAFGKIHVLCHNAGVAVGGRIDEMSYDDWDWVMNVNLQGVINGVVTFIDRIKSHGEGGHIVNTASMAGLISLGRMGVYNTTKYAVVGMSEVMRIDLEPLNIGVSVLCPGIVDTNIFTSERNRPAELSQNAAPSLNVDASTVSQEIDVESLRHQALDPAVVGEMVLHGIKQNEPYIFSHPEFKGFVLARMQPMNESFDRWTSWRAENDS